MSFSGSWGFNRPDSPTCLPRQAASLFRLSHQILLNLEYRFDRIHRGDALTRLPIGRLLILAPIAFFKPISERRLKTMRAMCLKRGEANRSRPGKTMTALPRWRKHLALACTPVSRHKPGNGRSWRGRINLSARKIGQFQEGMLLI